MARPKSSGSEDKELDKVEKQFESIDQNIKSMTLDRMNMAPKQETEPQTKIAQSDMDKMRDVYLKPKRSISCRDKFNESYREEYNYEKEYVQFIAENKEIIGESISMWTRPFAGMPAEEWDIPVNKPVWAPRYVAEQLKRKNYHRLVMQDVPTSQVGGMQFYGAIGVETKIQRLDAHPVNSNRKSVFMGSNTF